MTNKCTYCQKQIPEGEEIYLDESGVDGVFCNNNICAEAFICDAVETVDHER